MFQEKKSISITVEHAVTCLTLLLQQKKFYGTVIIQCIVIQCTFFIQNIVYSYFSREYQHFLQESQRNFCKNPRGVSARISEGCKQESQVYFYKSHTEISTRLLEGFLQESQKDICKNPRGTSGRMPEGLQEEFQRNS